MIPDFSSRLAGQVVLAGFPAEGPPPELLSAAARGEVGGFVLFRRNLVEPAQVAELNARLIAACPPDLPPWIAVDQEGGRVRRLAAPVLQLPPMRRLAALDDADLLQRVGAVVGAQLSALGFNLNLAPVLDVDSNPENPVIGDRAFADSPDAVIRLAGAFARGLLSAGIAACGKHFPGHGDTSVDSHLELPALAHDAERLSRVELAPFRALGPELPALMSAHIVYRALDPAHPATLSPAVLQGLLRGQLGYRGLILSDDLEMGAIANQHGIAEAACEAIAAGCDAVLICSRPDLALAAHEALALRAERDPAFLARLEDAATRGLEARRAYAPRATAPAQAFAAVEGAAGDLPGELERRLGKA